MPEPRPNKIDKREQAREAARVAREKQLRRAKLRRWLIPTSVSVAVVAIVAVVVLVVATSAPPPQTCAGPKNMISDGILFTGVDGVATPTMTAAIPAKGTPSPHPSDVGGDVPHIVEYIDFACPYCDQFESANSATIRTLVAAGKATLEVRPVSILDRSFEGTRYASRAINAGACVANFAPGEFLDVMAEFYAQQPKENTAGLTNAQILSLVHTAGVRDADVDRCISGETFASWVTAATNRFTSDSSNAGPQGIGTPTIKVDGKLYDGSLTESSEFISFLASASN